MKTNRIGRFLVMLGWVGIASVSIGDSPRDARSAEAAPAKSVVGQSALETSATGLDGPKLSEIRLGRTRDEVVTKYGKPIKTTTLASGIESMSYQHGTVRLLVEISPKNNRVIQIYHFKNTPFTGTQIGELLDRNAEGSKWRPIPASEGDFRFERRDGGTMRIRKLTDEYMLAVLSGSEVRGRDATTDAAREREVAESLREIE